MTLIYNYSEKMLSQDDLDKLTEWFVKSPNKIKWLFSLLSEQRWDENFPKWVAYVTQKQINDLLSWENNEDED